MCHSRVIPTGALMRTNRKQLFLTLVGAYASKGNIQMNGTRLPAFDKKKVVEGHEFEVFEGECAYDIMLGGGLLSKSWYEFKIEGFDR